MKVLSWVGGLVVAAAVASGATAVVAAHLDTGSGTLTASHVQQRVQPEGSKVEGGLQAERALPHLTREAFPHPSPSPGASPPRTVAQPAPRAVAAPRPAAVAVYSLQQALINQDRAAHGLPPLAWSSCLYSVAVSNARRIAAQEYLSHTNGPQVDLGCGLGHQAGENIGYWSRGVNDSQLNTMFMNSPDHRANILGPYHHVATAWVVGANGYGYIAVEFS